MSAGYTNASYGAGYCYNQTIGGLTKGDWFLPSAKELQTIYNNKSTINNAITNADGTIIGTGSHWSSTEYGTHSAWWLFELEGNGDLSSASKGNGGNVRCAVAY